MRMATRRPEPTFAKRVGRNVQRLRGEANLTQEAFAEEIGVSPRYIQSIEAGTGLPSLTIADAMRQVLKTSWNTLLG